MATTDGLLLTLPRPPHRVERLRAWLEEENLDCAVLFGADHVNHFTSYSRYFAGPSSVVVGADGERTLVVMLDEAPIAQRESSADAVIGFGERGFGLDLAPGPKLAAAVAELPVVAGARRIGLADELGGFDALLGISSSAEQV